MGDDGAIQFQIMLMPKITSIEVVADAELLGWALTDAGYVMATDLGVHWREDPGERGFWGVSKFDTCPAFEDEECWYTGSSLAAEPVMKEWAAAGFDDKVIERHLQELYDYEFARERHG